MHTWLPALIERVNAAYPNLELEIEDDITPNLRERLVGKDLDLALLLGPIKRSEYPYAARCARSRSPSWRRAGLKLPDKTGRPRDNREIPDS